MKDFLSFDRFCDLADAIINQIPEMFKEGISGIFVSPEEFKDEEIPGVYVLGHYHRGGYLEPWIDIYYGSFRQVFRKLSPGQLEEQLWETITHEIRHHLEENAGLHTLAIYDQQLKEYFRAHK